MKLLEVTFDGYKITDLIIVAPGFSREIGIVEKIKMPFSFYPFDNTKRRTLAFILSVDEPKQLIFSDEPDKYYLATATEIKFDDKKNHGSGEIEWTIKDGIARSLVTKLKQSDASGKIEVSNLGTYKTWPIFRTTTVGENGVFTLLNSNGGVLQFGNPEELDGNDAVRSNRVLYASYNKTLPPNAVPNQGITSYPTYAGGDPNVQTGSFNYDEPETAAPVFSDSAVKRWNGPSYKVPIGTNTNGVRTGDFEFTHRFSFWNKTSNKQRGRVEFALNSDTKHGFGFVMRDSSATKRQLIIECHIFDIVGERSYDLDLKKFDGSFFELKIIRKGASITWQLGQIDSLKNGVNLKKGAIFTKTFTSDDYKDFAITNVFAYMMRYQKSEPVRMRFTDAKFTWINTPYWHDIKNIFQDGDELTIDTKERKLYLNDVEALDSRYHSIDNMWEKFAMEPGITQYQVVQSEWAEPLTVTVEFEEHWT